MDDPPHWFELKLRYEAAVEEYRNICNTLAKALLAKEHLLEELLQRQESAHQLLRIARARFLDAVAESR